MFKLIFDNIYCSCFPCSDSLSWFILRKCLLSIQVWITIVCQLSFQIKMVFHESQLLQLATDIMQVFRTTFKLQYAAGVRLRIFNWRIIALQYCGGFFQTWVSHRFAHVPFHLNTTPPPSPFILWVVTKPQFESLESHHRFPLATCFTYGNVCFHALAGVLFVCIPFCHPEFSKIVLETWSLIKLMFPIVSTQAWRL